MQRILSLVLVSLLAACHGITEPEPRPQQPDPHAHPAPTGAEGVDGVVIKLVGDFEPCSLPCSTSGTTTPLSVPVHVFRGAHRVVEKLDPKDPALVQSVLADEKGFYQAELPPGVYTVIAEIDGKLYLNAYQGGTDEWATVTVATGAWTEHSIDDDSQAAF
jgi:hypothetical protein